MFNVGNSAIDILMCKVSHQHEPNHGTSKLKDVSNVKHRRLLSGSMRGILVPAPGAELLLCR